MSGKGLPGLYKVPTKGESEGQIGEGDQIKFIDFRFKKKQVVGFRKGSGSQNVP